jgi:hypothetical protein
VVALWQNKKANQTNANILFEQKANTKRPCFIIENVKLLNRANSSEINFNNIEGYRWQKGYIEGYNHVLLYIKNIGEGTAFDLKHISYLPYPPETYDTNAYKLSNAVNSEQVIEILLNDVNSKGSPESKQTIIYRNIAGIVFEQFINIKYTETNIIMIEEISLQEIVKETNYEQPQ